MCTAICKSILYGVDRCAIQVNRWGVCARKTVGAAVILVPSAVVLSSSFVINATVPMDTAAQKGVLVSGVALTVISLVSLVYRCSWLLRPAGTNKRGDCLPEHVAELLQAEVANSQLPAAYRADCARCAGLRTQVSAPAEEVQQPLIEQEAISV